MEESTVFTLMEGSCPNHPSDKVRVTHLSGMMNFLQNHFTNVRNIQKNVWSGMIPGDATDGEIEFTCPHGCVFTVAHNTYGDWNL